MNQPLAPTAAEGDYRVRLTIDEFLVVAEMPPFDEMKLELVHGAMERMPPPEMPHSRCQTRLVLLLNAAAANSTHLEVLTEIGVDLGEDTLVGCDVVIARATNDGRRLTAANVVLAVEVASTTLARDLGMKRREYARAGLPDYWVVDVEGRTVYRFTAPNEGEYQELEPVAFGAPLPVPGTDQTITLD